MGFLNAPVIITTMEHYYGHFIRFEYIAYVGPSQQVSTVFLSTENFRLDERLWCKWDFSFRLLRMRCRTLISCWIRRLQLRLEGRGGLAPKLVRLEKKCRRFLARPLDDQTATTRIFFMKKMKALFRHLSPASYPRGCMHSDPIHSPG